MTPEDGGPAFPLAYLGEEEFVKFHGMTLRDYFAAKAMPAMLRTKIGEGDEGIAIAIAAKAAYIMADAMLRARDAE